MNILISACLLGLYCRYDGKIKQYENIKELLACPEIHIIPICPEQAGGLATPRAAAERQGKRVITRTGVDVTTQYEQGATTACELAKKFHCSYAVLKEKSPSCGSHRIYDGTFTRTLIRGDGVTAAALKQIGVTIIGESQILDFLKTIKKRKKINFYPPRELIYIPYFLYNTYKNKEILPWEGYTYGENYIL